jgi:hypothetical protein
MLNRYIITIALMLFSMGAMKAQCTDFHPGLKQRFKESSLVIEGKVIGKEAFYDNSQQYIYTRNLIEPYRSFKGKAGAIIELVTPGGILGNDALLYSGALHLDIGQSGVFFLQAYQGRILENTPDASFLWGTAGKSTFIAYRPDGKKAYDGQQVYASVEHLYQALERISGQEYKMLLEADEPAIPRNPLMAIHEILPPVTNAGVDDTLIIRGEGFGEVAGTIFFSNADNGGQGYTSTYPWHIVSWADTLLQVKVPHKAGTGRFIVLGATGVAFSEQAVDVNFAHTNVVSAQAFYQPRLVDESGDDDGGYRFSLSDNTDNGGVAVAEEEGALDALVRAAGAWRDSIGVPLYVNAECPTTSQQAPGGLDDDINLITFDNDSWDLALEVSPYTLAVTVSRYARCEHTDWELVDVDIVMRRNGHPNHIGHAIDWHFGPEMPSETQLDFQSVMVHEFGHAIQLQHVVDPEAVMNYSTTYGEVKRHLGYEDDMAGASFVIGHSTAYEPLQVNCWPTAHFTAERHFHLYDPTKECGFDTSQIEGLTVPDMIDEVPDQSLRVYPNPLQAGHHLQLLYAAAKEGTAMIRVEGASGAIHFQINLNAWKGTNEWQIELPALSPGLYFITVNQGGEHKVGKLVVF